MEMYNGETAEGITVYLCDDGLDFSFVGVVNGKLTLKNKFYKTKNIKKGEIEKYELQFMKYINKQKQKSSEFNSCMKKLSAKYKVNSTSYGLGVYNFTQKSKAKANEIINELKKEKIECKLNYSEKYWTLQIIVSKKQENIEKIKEFLERAI